MTIQFKLNNNISSTVHCPFHVTKFRNDQPAAINVAVYGLQEQYHDIRYTIFFFFFLWKIGNSVVAKAVQSWNACYDKYADNMLFCPLLRAPLPMGTFQWSFMWCRKDSDPAIPLSLIHYLTSISFSPLPNFWLLRDSEHPAHLITMCEESM